MTKNVKIQCSCLSQSSTTKKTYFFKFYEKSLIHIYFGPITLFVFVYCYLFYYFTLALPSVLSIISPKFLGNLRKQIFMKISKRALLLISLNSNYDKASLNGFRDIWHRSDTLSSTYSPLEDLCELLTKFDTSKLHGVDVSPHPKETSNKTLM